MRSLQRPDPSAVQIVLGGGARRLRHPGNFTILCGRTKTSSLVAQRSLVYYPVAPEVSGGGRAGQ